MLTTDSSLWSRCTILRNDIASRCGLARAQCARNHSENQTLCWGAAGGGAYRISSALCSPRFVCVCHIKIFPHSAIRQHRRHQIISVPQRDAAMPRQHRIHENIRRIHNLTSAQYNSRHMPQLTSCACERTVV